MDTNDKADKGVNAGIIGEFDGFLAKKGLTFQGVVVGAASLILLDIIDRRTKDCDVLEPIIPDEIKRSSVEFARRKSDEGYDLPEGWLNNGPASLKDMLPEDWRVRTRVVYQGKALTLLTLGRLDLLRAKLFGYCDRGTDLDDCVALKPTREELEEVIEWVKKQDANPMWPKYVEEQFRFLEDRLGVRR